MSESSSDHYDKKLMAKVTEKKTEPKTLCVKVEDITEAPALVKSGFNLEVDMKLGWRPKEQKVAAAAPIPLYYEYER